MIGVVAGISGGGDDTKPTASPTKSTSAPTKATSSAVPSDTTSVTSTPTPTPTPSKSTKPATDEVLTVKNSKALRKLLTVGGYCSETVARFASKYQGRTITFDGSVSAVSNHGNYNTRFDFLLVPGDVGPESGSGPTFQFQNVNYYDLNFTGKNVPDSVICATLSPTIVVRWWQMSENTILGDGHLGSKKSVHAEPSQ